MPHHASSLGAWSALALPLVVACLPAALGLGSDFAWTWQNWQQEKPHLTLHDAFTSALSAKAPEDANVVLKSTLGILSAQDWRQVVHDDYAGPVQLAPLHFFTAKAASQHMRCALCAYTAEAAFDALALSLHEFFVDARIRPLGSWPDEFVAPAWRRQGACSHERMADFLAARAVYEVQPRGQPAQTSSASGPSHFAMCTRTAPGRLSAEEVLAATLACESMATESLTDAVASEEAKQIFGAYEREYERTWHTANERAKTRTVMKMLPSDCTDRNLSCNMWALIGECHANPRYMVGVGEVPGHCMRACGICPEFDPWATMHEDDEGDLRALMAQQRAQYAEHVCAAPCALEHQLVWGADAACASGPRPKPSGPDFKSALQWHVRVRPKVKAKLAESKRKQRESSGAGDGKEEPASLLDTVSDAGTVSSESAAASASHEKPSGGSARVENDEYTTEQPAQKRAQQARDVTASEVAALLRDAVAAAQNVPETGSDGEQGSQGPGVEQTGSDEAGHDREGSAEDL